MNVDALIDAIGKIDPRYVEEAEREQNFSESFVSEMDSKSRQTVTVQTKKERHGGWKKQRTLWLSLAACIGLLVLVGTTGVLYINLAPSADSTADACYEESAEATGMAENDMIEEEAAVDLESGVEDLAQDKIVINEWEEIASIQTDIQATNMTAENISAEELEAYYGVKIFPEQLPEDLTISAELQKNYYLYYDKDGNLTADENEVFYQSKDGVRSLQIFVSGVTGKTDTNDWEVSVIDGYEVVLLHWQSSQGEEKYRAEFENGDVYFKVDGTNLTQEEILDIVRDLLKNE